MAASLHSKLDSASDVTSPTRGTGGTEVGSPSYVPGYLHNGILSDANNEGCTFPTAANSINLDKGSISFYAKMNFDETSGDTHYFFDFYDAGNGGIRFYYDPVVNDFRLEAWQGGVKRTTATTIGMSWTVGDILHFELLWDRGGTDIRSNETLGIFIDKTMEAKSITVWNADTVNNNLYIGIDKDGANHSDAVIDELKAHDYCIFIGNYWKEVAPRLDGGVHVHDLCVYKGKLYGTYDGTNTKLVEWNGVNAWVKRVAALEARCLIVFDGKLYAGPDDLGQVWYWNDIDAWVMDVDLGTLDVYEMVEYHGQLFAGTSIGAFAGGRLYRRESAGTWSMVADQVDGATREIRCLCVHNDKIYAGTLNGKLLEWNGVDAWTVVADLGVGNSIHDLLSYEDVQRDAEKGEFVKVQRLLAVGSGFGGRLWEWNGVDALIVLVTTPPPAIDEIHDLLLFQGDPILGVCHGTPKSLLVMWDGASSWIPVTTNNFDVWSDAIAVFNGKIYAGSYQFGTLGEWVPDAPNKPTDLLCCDKASSGHGESCSPALIDTLTPYFSAIFTDPGEDDIATGYWLRVNTAPDMGGTDLWESGEIPMTSVSNGQRCENITYTGLALTEGVTYYWKIRFYDQDGVLGDWSDINCFRIGPGAVPYDLWCEQKTNPRDVTDTHPEFSAIYP